MNASAGQPATSAPATPLGHPAAMLIRGDLPLAVPGPQGGKFRVIHALEFSLAWRGVASLWLGWLARLAHGGPRRTRLAAQPGRRRVAPHDHRGPDRAA